LHYFFLSVQLSAPLFELFPVAIPALLNCATGHWPLGCVTQPFSLPSLGSQSRSTIPHNVLLLNTRARHNCMHKDVPHRFLRSYRARGSVLLTPLGWPSQSHPPTARIQYLRSRSTNVFFESYAPLELSLRRSMQDGWACM